MTQVRGAGRVERGRRSGVVPVLIAALAVFTVVVALATRYVLSADHGRFAESPDPCQLLSPQDGAALGTDVRVRPGTALGPSARRCDISAGPRDDAPGVSLEAEAWSVPTLARDLHSATEGIRVSAGPDAVAVPGLGDEAWANPGIGWLTVRVSNVSLRFIADVDLLTSRSPDDIQAVLRPLAGRAVERLP